MGEGQRKEGKEREGELPGEAALNSLCNSSSWNLYLIAIFI
jgi:hypothetical protein